jgi:hypothetical protein
MARVTKPGGSVVKGEGQAGRRFETVWLLQKCNTYQKVLVWRKGLLSRDYHIPLKLAREFLACLWPFLFPMNIRR